VLGAVAVAVVVLASIPRPEQGPPELTFTGVAASPAAIGDMASVYLTVANGGGSDRLVSASATAAAVVTLHDTEIVDGGGLMIDTAEMVVPAGGTLALVPGARHLMLHHVFEALEPGDVVVVSVTFERAGTVELEVPVLPYVALSELNPSERQE
jgi:copper(I)-binding protein